jgi:hypothetical protein
VHLAESRQAGLPLSNPFDGISPGSYQQHPQLCHYLSNFTREKKKHTICLTLESSWRDILVG